jgi:hypothetical protein
MVLEGVTTVEIINPKIGSMLRAAAKDPNEFWAEAGRMISWRKPWETVLGATGVKIEGNLITGNVPSADTKFSGGVVVTSSLGDSAIAPADNGVHGRWIPMATKPAPPITCRHEVPAEHGPHLAPCLTWTAAGPLTGFVTGFRVKAASLSGDLSGVWRWF